MKVRAHIDTQYKVTAPKISIGSTSRLAFNPVFSNKIVNRLAGPFRNFKVLKF